MSKQVWSGMGLGRRRAVVLTLAMLAMGVAGRPTVVAGEVTDADRKALLAHLERTEQQFLASIQGLSEAQWKWKAAPDRWSVAEVAEHITVSENTLRGMVADQVMK